MKSRVLSIFAIVAVFCCGIADAQVPRKLNYQGFLTSPSGAPVNSAGLQMVFNIYNVQTLGSPLHTETQTVTVSNGIFNVLLGTSTALTLPFDAQYYLGVTPGLDPKMSPRQPLAASPYAIRAASAEAATKLATARTINGVAFDGTANITVPAGVPSLTGLVLGIVTAPKISFSADADTGIFSPGANQIALAAGGELLLHNRGTNNFAAGRSALSTNTSGSENVAAGPLALWLNTTGSDSLAAGAFALVYNDGGSRNVATGSDALVNNITGNDNVAVGFKALNGNGSGGGNVAAGSNALLNSSGNNNIASARPLVSTSPQAATTSRSVMLAWPLRPTSSASAPVRPTPISPALFMATVQR